MHSPVTFIAQLTDRTIIVTGLSYLLGVFDKLKPPAGGRGLRLPKNFVFRQSSSSRKNIAGRCSALAKRLRQ